MFQKHDVLGKQFGQPGIDHGVTTIFDHDRFTGVTLHKGQRFGNDVGLCGGGHALAVVCAHALPVN